MKTSSQPHNRNHNYQQQRGNVEDTATSDRNEDGVTRSPAIITIRTKDNCAIAFRHHLAHFSEVLSAKIADGIEVHEIDDARINGEVIGQIREWCEWHHANPHEDLYDDTDEEDEDDEDSSVSANRYSIEYNPTSNRIRERMRFVWIPDWDMRWMRAMDHPTLFRLITAAHSLKIRRLLKVTSKTIANMIKGKSPETVRKFFSIVDDLPSAQASADDDDDEDDIRIESRDYSRTKYAILPNSGTTGP